MPDLWFKERAASFRVLRTSAEIEISTEVWEKMQPRSPNHFEARAIRAPAPSAGSSLLALTASTNRTNGQLNFQRTQLAGT
jgi:hypothetical protein